MERHLLIMQRDIRDCGVCSLQSIIKYHGGFIPLERLRLDTHTDTNGSTFFHLLKAALNYGFEGMGITANIDNIKAGEIVLPAIVHLNLKNGLTHFAVLYKVNKNHVLLMDPAVGFVRKKINDFEAEWTGRVLLLSPIGKVIKLTKTSNIKSVFLKIISLEKRLIIKLLIIGIIISIVSIINSFYLKFSIDGYNNTQNIRNIWIIIVVFLIFHLVKVIMDYFKNYYENYLNKNLDIRLIIPFIKHIFLLPLNIVKSRSAGEITSRINDLNNIKNLFSKIFITMILDLLLALVSMLILFSISNSLFYVLIIVVFFYLLVGMLFSGQIYKKILGNINAETELNSLLIEKITSLATIKNINNLDYMFNVTDREYTRYLKNTFHLNKFINLFNFIKSFIYEIGIFCITSFGIYWITQGRITVLNLITFNYLYLYLFSPIKNLVDVLPNYHYLKVTIQKISEFYELDIENTEYGINDFSIGDLKIENLSFSYNDYHYLFQNINYVIAQGEKIFFKGESGSGKSTLCKLIYRLMENTEGKITINNINIKDINLKVLRENIIYLGQRENLFTNTIKNNIVLNSKLSTEKFKNIVDICMIEKIIDKKKLRYESLLVDAGYNLSGGEKQRLCLARALCKKAEIIILDEPLSEVDEKMETRIIKNILQSFSDKTLIYISHRDKSKLFDRTIVLEK